MPSTFPEAFGMVAAEAAACGALPVVAGHSGMAEVAEALAAAVPPEVRPWLTFAVGPDAVTQLAEGLASWLAAPEELRARTREAIVGVARERYSWDGVARTVDRRRRGPARRHPAAPRPDTAAWRAGTLRPRLAPPRRPVGCRAMRGRVRCSSPSPARSRVSGCELKDDGDNLVNGKTLFAERCSSCHTLARAGAKGITGPNLDEAWQQADADGFGRSTYEGLVHRQILQPNRRAQVDPATGKGLPLMPANLVKGDDAQDVAAYVAFAAAKGGEDSGRLANAGDREAGGPGRGRGRQAGDPRRTGRADALHLQGRRGAGRPDRDRLGQRVPGRPQHRDRGQRRQRGGRRRQGRRHLDRPGRPAARRVHVLLLRARPPRGRHGGQAHRQVAARARSAASSRSCWRAACQKKKASAKTMIRMSTATMIAPAVCWSASAPTPRRSPLP